MPATNANMTRVELKIIHKELTLKAAEILARKNADYAHEADVFRNFRLFGGLGILVRLSDKLARLRTFEERGTFDVSDESLIDTTVDIINYAILYFALKQENKGTQIEYKRTQIANGPYCDTCEELADFAAEDNSALTCSNCACEKGIETKDMFTLETV